MMLHTRLQIAQVYPGDCLLQGQDGFCHIAPQPMGKKDANGQGSKGKYQGDAQNIPFLAVCTSAGHLDQDRTQGIAGS